MTSPLSVVMQWTDWFELLVHFFVFSVSSIGGPLVLLPEIHHYLVTQQQWLTTAQFSASVVIAQAAPGPNVLFVALLGWNIGFNAGGLFTGFASAVLCMVGMLLPSCSLIFVTARWVYKNRDLIAVRAFKLGMGPIVIALLIASGWMLATGNTEAARDWPLWVVTAATTVIVARTKINMFWLLLTGAALGASGLLVVS
ncbi:MAG: chromate transporter [Alcaligenaceae bacterium]